MANENIKGLTIEFSADTTQFNKQMKNFNKSLSSTKKQAKSLTDSLKMEWDADKFVKAQQLAQKAITDTEYKAEVLRNRLKQMEETGIKTDKQQVEYEKLQAMLVKTEVDAQKLQKQLENLNNLKIENLQKQFDKVGQSITKAGQAMIPVSATAGAMVASITGATLKTVEYADEIATLATQLGVSNEQMQRFQYIAMQTDVSNERLTKGFTKLRTAVGQSMLGTSNMATKALDELGFTMDNLQGKSDEQIFEEVIAQLGKVSNTSEQAALASQIFGERVATDLIPLIKTGADTLAELNAEFDASGALTEEQINDFAEFDETLNKIKTTFANISYQIAHAFLPVFEKIAEVIETKIIPKIWEFVEVIKGLSTKQKGLILGIGSLVAALAPALLVIGKLTSGIGGMIPTIAKLSGVMKGALGPVGIILGILTLLYSTNEKFRDSINNLISILMSSLAPIFTMLGDIFNEFMAVLQPLITMLGDVLANVLTTITPIFEMLLAILMPIVNIILKDFLTRIKMLSSFIEILMAVVKPLITLLNSVFAVVLHSTVMPLLSTLMSMISGITGLISPLMDWITKLTDKFKNFVVKALEPVADALKFVWDIIKKILGIKDKEVDMKVNYKVDDVASPVNAGEEKKLKLQHELNRAKEKEKQLIEAMQKLDEKGLETEKEKVAYKKLQRELEETRGNISRVSSTLAEIDPMFRAFQQQETLKNVVTNNQAISNISNTTSNYTDNSTKNVTINVTVENYAEEVDVDSLVEQINVKLAEQF